MRGDTMAFPNLRAEMTRRGLTISTMAQDMKITRETMARRLSGNMRVKDAMAMRDKFFPDCELDYLLEQKN